MIPLFDLQAQYLSIKTEVDEAISGVIAKGSFIRGGVVDDFEEAFAAYLGVSFCHGVGNGTDALEIILKALEIKPGDEVLVPALTWIATAEAVNNIGAKPVFVDVDAVTYTINVEKIEEKISSKTRAIIPVHLYGCPAKMHELGVISKKHRLHLVEDCAQAHGAEYYKKKVGTFGIASAFSFFPTKNLGAFGDAGAIVTDDPVLYEKIKRISNHGQSAIKHEHKLVGRNSRLDTIQAAILYVKLKHLDDWNQKRIKAAEYYSRKLSDYEKIVLPSHITGTKHVYHLYVVRTKIRDRLIDMLKKKGISCAVHYPKPLPFTEAYFKKNESDNYPVSQHVTSEILSLPLYPEIENKMIDFICDQIIETL